MKRTLTTLFTLLIFASIAKAKTFPDVPESHFAYPAIETLYSLKVLKGYEDGTFKPDKSVTRVEALKIIMESAKLAVPEVSENETVGFSDIDKGQWYVRYIKKGKDLNIIKGNSDGTFAPQRQVNKVELLKMLFLTNKIDVSGYKNDQGYPYLDIDTSAWYYPYISYAIKYNIVSPNEKTNIEPAKMLTRADVAETVYRLLLISKIGDLQSVLSQSESLLVQALANIEKQRFDKAKENTKDAVNLTEKAKNIASEKPIVLAANKVALSMDKLAQAYISLSNGKKEVAITQSEEAIKIGNEAKSINQGVEPLIEKIKIKAQGIINHAKN